MTETIDTPDGTLTVTHDPDITEAYVTSVTVSTERKRSDGDYGSDTEFASQTVQLNPALALRDNGPSVIAVLDKARHVLTCHIDESGGG